MARKKQKLPIRHHLKNWFVPHKGNNHHPHYVRTSGLIVIAILVISLQFVGHYVSAGKGSVLGYASAISVNEVVTLTNQERVSAGLGALATSGALNVAAANKAADMFAHDYWAHVSPSGVQPWYWIEQAGYSYLYAGENLAKDFNTSSGVVAGWMGSAGHRDNILNANYQNIGVAAVNGTLLGSQTTLVVAMYGSPYSAAPVAPAAPATQSQPTQTVEPEVAPAPAPAVTEPTPVAQLTEAEQQPQGQTVDLPLTSQTLQSAPDVKSYNLFRPMLALGNLRATDFASIGLLGVGALINISRHTTVWRLHRDKIKQVWFRSHPLAQAGLLIAAIVMIVIGGYGVVG